MINALIVAFLGALIMAACSGVVLFYLSPAFRSQQDFIDQLASKDRIIASQQRTYELQRETISILERTAHQ